MYYRKLTYLAFYAAAFISLLVAIFFEKIDLLYTYPLSFLSIVIIYLKEKKGTTSILFILALAFGLAGAILLISDFKECVTEVSICISLFYLLYLRLMYLKNIKMKTTMRTYFILLFISLPIIYVYNRVISLIYSEISNGFIYFSVMVLFMLGYIVTALYYYLRNKNQSNLWMLITAVNLGIMNIIIMINELYLYDTMFTVVAVFCSNLMLFFSLRFMLEDDKNTVSHIIHH